MSDLLSRLSSDKEFALALQAQANTVRSPEATAEDADKLLQMMAETPEQLQAMRAVSPGDPKVMSVTITTITTLTTAF